MENRPYIGAQYTSLFYSGRPALPWDIADVISVILAEADIDELGVGVTGSLCPSVLTTLAYDAPERKVNAFAFTSAWSKGVGWNSVIEDSPGMEEEVPWANMHLPSKNIHFWDGATPFFHSEALFIDLPFSHRCVGLNIKSLRPSRNRLLMLGFLEEHDGPEDILDWAKHNNYQLEEHKSEIENVEYDKTFAYKLIVAKNTSL